MRQFQRYFEPEQSNSSMSVGLARVNLRTEEDGTVALA